MSGLEASHYNACRGNCSLSSQKDSVASDDCFVRFWAWDAFLTCIFCLLSASLAVTFDICEREVDRLRDLLATTTEELKYAKSSYGSDLRDEVKQVSNRSLCTRF